MPKSHSINQKGEKALTDQENKMSKFRSGIEIDDAESMEEDTADDNSQDEEIVRMDTETAIENGQNDHYIKEIDIILKSMVIGKAFGKANNSKRTSFMMKNVGSAKDSLIIQNCQVWSNDFKDHTKFNYGKTIDVGCQFHFKAETISIVGDGNCMFNAISTALYGHMYNQADLRKILIIGLEQMLNRLMIGNGFSPQDDWVILSVPGNGVTYVDNLTQHIDYIKMDTAWGTDFDVAVLGNVLKKRFGIFYPSLNGKSYNFSMILPGSQSQTWPLVFLHNTNLNHFDLIQNLATPNQLFEVQDEEELMEIDSDKNMSFVEENPIPLTIASIPMSEKNRNFLAEKGKNGPKVRRQRRELNDISPVKQIASSRAQRAAARSLVCQSKIGPAITKSNIKKSVEPKIAKTVTKCCARNPNKIPLQHTLGKLNVKCKCKAVFFEKEKTFKQCCNGHLTFKEFDNFPAELQGLWTAISDDSNYFRNNSRFFNSKFCFASLNSEQRVLEGRGPPVYVIHGPVYRLFNTAMPETTQEATFAQMYLYGPERGGDLRVDGLNESRDRKLIRKLSEIIGDCNVFAKSYKTFHDFMVAERDRAILEDVLLPVYQLRLVGPQSDDRVRNLPVDNEVAAIYYGNDTEEMAERKDIFVTSKDGKRKPIHHMDKLRDALTYPLLFPLGNPTYDPNTLFNLKRISRITYYQNLIEYRPQVFNPLHYAGLLFQQFLVDVFTTVETDWLNYIRQFELFKLDQNMRVNQDEEEFAKWVLNVGDGNEKCITNNKISIPQIIRSSGDLIKEVFEGQDQDSTDKWTSVILASTNKTVDTINETVLDKVIPGEVVHLLSADLLLPNPSVAEDIQNLPIEYLNSLAPSGMPVHDLRLKLNCIVMVLRNLNIKNGICNGTRLIVKGINSKFITCEHILNPRIDETVFIPRIILMSSEKEFPFTFSRKQFPVRLAYAMTINKSQGQTLSRVGLDLTKNCFSHGQLYVGLSRIKSPKNLFVSTPNEKEIQTNITDNIVYKEVL